MHLSNYLCTCLSICLSVCLSIQSNYCLSTWHILYQILEGPTVSKVATQQAHPALHIPIKKATNYINISGFLWMLAYPFVIKRGKWRFSMVYQWFSWVNQRNKWWIVKLPCLISRAYVSLLIVGGGQWFSWVNQRNKWWIVKLPCLISRAYVCLCQYIKGVPKLGTRSPVNALASQRNSSVPVPGELNRLHGFEFWNSIIPVV